MLSQMVSQMQSSCCRLLVYLRNSSDANQKYRGAFCIDTITLLEKQGVIELFEHDRQGNWCFETAIDVSMSEGARLALQEFTGVAVRYLTEFDSGSVNLEIVIGPKM